MLESTRATRIWQDGIRMAAILGWCWSAERVRQGGGPV